MTVSELAAVLERQSDIYDAAMEIPDVVAALRESAAILRRLGDGALAQRAAQESTEPPWHVADRAIDKYRHRVETPAEGEKP